MTIMLCPQRSSAHMSVKDKTIYVPHNTEVVYIFIYDTSHI